MTTVTTRPIHAIAHEIHRLWPNPHYAALPYLSAMFHISKITDKYFAIAQRV